MKLMPGMWIALFSENELIYAEMSFRIELIHEFGANVRPKSLIL